MPGTSNGKRSGGRPKTRWIDEIKATMGRTRVELRALTGTGTGGERSSSTSPEVEHRPDGPRFHV